MKRLIEFFAEQKLFGDLLTIVIIGLGLYSLLTIRREAFPSIEFDIIEVSTTWPGASAAEVEQLITNPLEKDLKEIDGIKKMTSTSVDGRSLIFLELDVNATNVEKAKSDCRDVVDVFHSEAPEDADDTVIKSLETRENPILEVSISGNIPLIELRKNARRIERELENIRGVAGVDMTGVEDREIHVSVNPKRLSRFGLSLDDLVSALKRRNVSIPGGTIETSDANDKELVIRTSGQFTTAKEVAATVVRANELAQPVEVGDVAEVTEALKRTSVLSRTDGVPSIRLTVKQKEKADIITVADSVVEEIKRLQPTLPQGLELKLVNDQSEFVRRRLGVLFGNFTIGMALVLLFLPMFLPFRFALLVAIGEPFAFLGTLLAFQFADQSLNLISVIGLILVSGILVDDGIVVVENVARLIKEKGMSPKKAAIAGAQQVWQPIIASSMTTMVAFIPLATMTGIFGKFVKYIPLGVIVPIFISLFENFFIMPHHVGTWLRASDFDLTQRKGIFGSIRYHTDQWWERWALPRYLGALDWILRRRYLLMTIVTPGAVVMAGLLAVFVMKIILFPPEQVEIFMIRMDGVQGASLKQTTEVLQYIEKEVLALPKEEWKNSLTLVGIQAQDSHDPTTRRGAEFGQVTVFLTPETDRQRTAQQIIDDLRAKIGTPPGAQRVFFQRVNAGPPVGKPISVGVWGEEYEQILPASNALKEYLSTIKGVTDLTDSYVLGREQVNVNVNYREAAAAGLSVASIGQTVRAAYEGLIATSIRTLDEEINVRVFLAQESRETLNALKSLRILNPNGHLVPLPAVSSVTMSQSLMFRHHEANQREIRVSGEVDDKVISSQQVGRLIRKKLPELQKQFPNVTWHFGGEDQDTQESMESLGRAFVLAVIGIFLILIVTFKTFFQPLVVLITIPLGLLSVVLTFFLHGMPMSFLGMVGMVGLSGIIVNNAIVFVEFVNEARRAGMDRWESLKEAAKTRARPIFLTTITTVIAIMPTAYGIGGLDKFVVPIAMSMGWGLMMGSLLTLFLLPAALAILDDLEGFFDRKLSFSKEPQDK